MNKKDLKKYAEIMEEFTMEKLECEKEADEYYKAILEEQETIDKNSQ